MGQRQGVKTERVQAKAHRPKTRNRIAQGNAAAGRASAHGKSSQAEAEQWPFCFGMVLP